LLGWKPSFGLSGAVDVVVVFAPILALQVKRKKRSRFGRAFYLQSTSDFYTAPLLVLDGIGRIAAALAAAASARIRW
jgi:hypothetical protein